MPLDCIFWGVVLLYPGWTLGLKLALELFVLVGLAHQDEKLGEAILKILGVGEGIYTM